MVRSTAFSASWKKSSLAFSSAALSAPVRVASAIWEQRSKSRRSAAVG